MNQLPPQYHRSYQQPAVYLKPPPRKQRARARRRLRWNLLLVPVVILFASWLADGIEMAVTFDDLMNAAGIREKEAFAKYLTLAIVLATIVIILRIARGSQEHERK